MHRHTGIILALVVGACGGSGDPSDPGEPQPQGSVRGHVRAAADSGVANVPVTLQRAGQTARSATTDAAGSYTVSGLQAGLWTVTAAPITGYVANGSLTAQVQVQANQTTDAPVLRLRRAAPAPQLAEVTIADNSFTPASVTVAVNGTVRWTNGGTVQHNSTGAGLWASPNLAPGGTFERTFPAAGTFNYQCTLHAGMTGTVVVQ